jgi:hypothetical protein
MATVSSHGINGERESNGGGRGIRRRFLSRGEEMARRGSGVAPWRLRGRGREREEVEGVGWAPLGRERRGGEEIPSGGWESREGMVA